jgi:succinyl-CoA synthetase alpha subunit
MSIFINADSKIIVQGMTGSEGTKHTRRMLASGSKVVGGVTPGKGGQSVEIDGHNLPVFNTVGEAMAATGANVSVVFVPPKFAKAAVVDAIDAAMPLIVVITEGIPVHDSASFYAYSLAKGRSRIIGPNCPGLISPGKSNVGIIPANITGAGPIGLVSKSGTLTYQMMFELRDIGFSTAVGIGGDPVVGTTHIDCLRAFQDDPETEAIVMIGEIGGDAEERAAAFIAEYVTKTVRKKKFPNQYFCLSNNAFNPAHVVTYGFFIINITHITKIERRSFVCTFFLTKLKPVALTSFLAVLSIIL